MRLTQKLQRFRNYVVKMSLMLKYKNVHRGSESCKTFLTDFFYKTEHTDARDNVTISLSSYISKAAVIFLSNFFPLRNFYFYKISQWREKLAFCGSVGFALHPMVE
jgi:hypothetical protein